MAVAFLLFFANDRVVRALFVMKAAYGRFPVELGPEEEAQLPEEIRRKA